MLDKVWKKEPLRKSISRYVDKKSQVPEEERGVWGFWREDRGLEFSRRKKDKSHFSPHIP